MVKGKVLDREKILAIFRKADAVIAHNASFDRGFIIRLFPDTIENDWYCSVRQIKWKSYGFENGSSNSYYGPIILLGKCTPSLG